jgi:hypothetical protein
MVKAVMGKGGMDPHVANFEDGYRNAVICDAMLKSAKTGKKEKINY